MVPALAIVALLAAAPEQQALSVDPAASAVRYHLDHKMHSVDGRSSTLEGKAVIASDGKVLAMVRIPVASFDSGDANRDANMRETLEVGRHPYVVYKGVTSLVVPVAAGKPLEAVLKGELDFHGVKRPLDVPVKVEFAPDGSATVRGEMKVSLDAWGVERPSLLFVKVNDTLAIDLDLKLKRSDP
jgi:polyisoprenoid-binding protein YceI